MSEQCCNHSKQLQRYVPLKIVFNRLVEHCPFVNVADLARFVLLTF